jgi:hypothetical protein
MRDKVLGDLKGAATGFCIRSAIENDGKFSFTHGPINVCGQLGSITHRNASIELNLYLWSCLRCRRRARCCLLSNSWRHSDQEEQNENEHAMDTFGKFRHIGKHHDEWFFWDSSEGQGFSARRVANLRLRAT